MLAQPADAALWLLLPAAPLAFYVAWSDMARMKIPNIAVLALVAIFVLVGPLVMEPGAWALRLVHLAVVLVIGFMLNMIGAMGAGDAKFAAAMAPFVALGDAALFLYLFSAVLLAAFATHRAARAVPALRGAAPHWESWHRRDFPMGLALAGSLVLYLGLAAVYGA